MAKKKRLSITSSVRAKLSGDIYFYPLPPLEELPFEDEPLELPTEGDELLDGALTLGLEVVALGDELPFEELVALGEEVEVLGLSSLVEVLLLGDSTDTFSSLVELFALGEEVEVLGESILASSLVEIVFLGFEVVTLGLSSLVDEFALGELVLLGFSSLVETSFLVELLPLGEPSILGCVFPLSLVFTVLVSLVLSNSYLFETVAFLCENERLGYLVS